LADAARSDDARRPNSGLTSICCTIVTSNRKNGGRDILHRSPRSERDVFYLLRALTAKATREKRSK
jgi:hypothetical protein